MVTLSGSDGRKLTLRHNAENDLPAVERDGEPWDYAEHLDVYGPEGQAGPISQAWLSGTLEVEAGRRRFSCTVTEEGKVRTKKGPGLFCRNGPKGASHKTNQVPFSFPTPQWACERRLRGASNTPRGRLTSGKMPVDSFPEVLRPAKQGEPRS